MGAEVITAGQIKEVPLGYQLIRVSCPTIGKQIILSFDADGMTKLAGNDTYFSTTKDTSGKINIYKVSETSFAIQNSMGSSIGIKFVSI